MSHLLERRKFLAGIGAMLFAPKAWTASSQDLDVEVRYLDFKEDRPQRRSMVLVVPRHLPKGTRVPLLLLLHGRGEVGNVRTGAHAWVERYGLVSAYERLRRPQVAQLSKRRDWSDEALAAANGALNASPFRGLVIACPYTPDIRGQQVEAYARWVMSEAIPRAHLEAAETVDPKLVSIDGCSMGGPIALEVFLRHPSVFRAWGGVQSAIGTERAGSFADRIAAAFKASGPRPLHIETSAEDPFRPGNEALSQALRARGIAHELQVLPGPHDQPWLRESGTIEMLRWHDSLGDRHEHLSATERPR